MFILSVGLVIPIYEELIFRGFMYSRLIKAGLSVKWTIVISTLLFALLHLQFNVVDFFYLLTLSFFLTYIRYKTNNTFYSMAIHVQNNLIAIFIMMF